MIQPRRRLRLDGFFTADREWRELRDADSPPSGAQLRRLNALGMLELVNPAQAVPLTKAEASGAIAEVTL